MKKYACVCFTIFSIIPVIPASKCGCRTLTSCYTTMLDTLHDQDEAYCIEDAAIGTSSLTVYLRAISEYCAKVVNVTLSERVTHDVRHLYEVSITSQDKEREKEKPTIIIDAGQDAGTESVGFALFVIEQLIACQENSDMIKKVRWVIMPSTNPDGLEYSRYKVTNWKKNLRISEDEVSYGVDITRNFDQHWSACSRVQSGFSSTYPGPSPSSENETLFIKDVLSKYRQTAKIYLSLRRDGHHIGYPYAFSNATPKNIGLLTKIAAGVASKINVRSGSVRLFGNNSIYELEGHPHCGHSVDYAHEVGVSLAFEMCVFLGTDNRIMSKFQTLPQGYESSLRNGYFLGIRELYNVLTNEKKYGKIPY